ncbi:hypothetical protein CFC21_004765 [Triticum aestivum]|uniref:Uncharacterized protein n=2 Tax=Triticum aestivum TaxID=4565 RepID=A0A3B5YR27_WHEAT|nr:hypothetical protein CFC21_004765 [Triticum aestivum]
MVAAAREHSLPPCLKILRIWSCAGMLGGVLRLPTPLMELRIRSNSGLTSLEFLCGEHPPSLETLCLESCSTLASLPNEPRADGSLKQLVIGGCPAMKKLPGCLQQQLGSIDDKKLDARYEVFALKPKTWKKIPRIVRKWRQAARQAAQEAMERQRYMQE